MITIGSLFSGIGGFDLGCQRALDRYEIEHKILYHVEQNTFCQSILKKHWPESKIHNDVRDIGKHNLPYTDIIMGGFPCQNISVAGKQEGIHGEKSGLWWEMFRIISEIRPRIIVLENVSNILSLGGREVLGSLASLGYDAEWRVIRSGADFGAPHIRRRWFCIAYSNNRSTYPKIQTRRTIDTLCSNRNDVAYSELLNEQIQIKRKYSSLRKSRSESENGFFWRKRSPEPVLCGVDDGIPFRVARLKALGNAIVPQAAEYIFERIILSGLLTKTTT